MSFKLIRKEVMVTQDRIERGNLFQIVRAEKEKDLRPKVDLILGTVRICLSVDLREREDWHGTRSSRR